MSGFVRRCTVCLSRGIDRVAREVAQSREGAEWFECGQHSPRDNLVDCLRHSSTPIRQWFTARGLPPPETELPPSWPAPESPPQEPCGCAWCHDGYPEECCHRPPEKTDARDRQTD